MFVTMDEQGLESARAVTILNLVSGMAPLALIAVTGITVSIAGNNVRAMQRVLYPAIKGELEPELVPESTVGTRRTAQLAIQTKLRSAKTKQDVLHQRRIPIFSAMAMVSAMKY